MIEEGLEEIAVVLIRPVTGGRAAEKNKTIGSLGQRLGPEIGIESKMGGKPRPLYIGTHAAQSLLIGNPFTSAIDVIPGFRPVRISVIVPSSRKLGTRIFRNRPVPVGMPGPQRKTKQLGASVRDWELR